ncbi:phosphoserine phosphatase [Abyssogena phaseoliformis symbiont OG214]|uniref:phosphoserine phosphatase SerB n=1 Tax=Abyssogena phaseoliformis symbiont TaxID=596095 RepID=UPI0019366B55|nr:phosphoserine phosphatase SerB [Abyssogena phaseoliformis symbiont]MBW5289438.1 Phosphoserine phosphatase [Candidatus Ruthia sp. Apha_13_S6]BBB22346.1 phosphoserine phosphatase [Abyssogena phaseoliformis symbiont OG214]
MQIIIQHSLDENIARQISSNFQVFSTHIRHQIALINLDDLRQQYQTDFNHLPKVDTSNIKLFVCDMDSTLINIECIDEIADFANIKPQVTAITKLAMQGKLDFDDSLIKRVALLKGLSVDVLDKVYTQRLSVNPGGRALILFFKTKSIQMAVVSGGFTYFANRLAQDLALDYARANVLAVENNQLTGVTEGLMINAEAKADFIKELCDKQGLSYSQVIVAGDGANDLNMMRIAGLSVAYHAKPSVTKHANIVINFGGLNKIIDLFNP